MDEDDWLRANETLAPAKRRCQFLMTERLPGFNRPVLMVVATSPFRVASITGEPFCADDCLVLAGAVVSELMRYPLVFVSTLVARVVFCDRLLYMGEPRSMVWDDHRKLYVDVSDTALGELHHELYHMMKERVVGADHMNKSDLVFESLLPVQYSAQYGNHGIYMRTPGAGEPASRSTLPEMSRAFFPTAYATSCIGEHEAELWKLLMKAKDEVELLSWLDTEPLQRQAALLLHRVEQAWPEMGVDWRTTLPWRFLEPLIAVLKEGGESIFLSEEHGLSLAEVYRMLLDTADGSTADVLLDALTTLPTSEEADLLNALRTALDAPDRVTNEDVIRFLSAAPPKPPAPVPADAPPELPNELWRRVLFLLARVADIRKLVAARAVSAEWKAILDEWPLWLARYDPFLSRDDGTLVVTPKIVEELRVVDALVTRLHEKQGGVEGWLELLVRRLARDKDSLVKDATKHLSAALRMLAREAAGLVPLADGTAKLLQVALVHVAAVYANAAVGWVQPYGADKHHAPLLLSVHNPSLVLAKRPEERLALGLIGADGTVPYMLTDGEHGQSLMSVTLEQLLRNTLSPSLYWSYGAEQLVSLDVNRDRSLGQLVASGVIQLAFDQEPAFKPSALSHVQPEQINPAKVHPRAHSSLERTATTCVRALQLPHPPSSSTDPLQRSATPYVSLSTRCRSHRCCAST